MTVHFCLYPDSRMWTGATHIAVFFFSECHPSEMITITESIRQTIYPTIGYVYFNDWDWSSGIGRMKIMSKMGCDQDIFERECNRLLETITNK